MTLLVDALAAYRLTRLVTTDAITEPVRAAIAERATRGQALSFQMVKGGEPVGEVFRPNPNQPHPIWPWLDELVGCRWCTGVWVGLGVALARRAAPRAWDPIAQGLACAAAAALLARLEAED